MKRKVIKQGNGTLTITLPKDWTKKTGVIGGDEIDVQEQEGNFNLSISLVKNKHLKRAEIDITGLDFASIRHSIRAAYKLGYDEILVMFDKPEIVEFKTGKRSTMMKVMTHEIGMLLGCEIVEQKKNSILIKDFTFASVGEFDSILKKVFLLLCNYASDLVDGAKTMDKDFLEGMDEKHYNVTKFIFFCLRTLNKKGYKDFDKTPVMYYLISALDDCLDIMKYAGRDMSFFKQKNVKKETIDILKMISDQVHNYFEYFYKPNKNKLLHFAENRWKIVNKIKGLKNVPHNEVLVVTNMEHILELLLHLYEVRMSLDY